MMRSKIKAILKEIAITAILLLILTNIVSYLRQPELGSEQLPQIKVQLVDGSTFQTDEKQPLIIHFWAKNCPACKLEAPNIQTVSKKHHVLSIAVNSGTDAQIKAYMQKHALSFKVLNDTEAIWAKKFNIDVYPTTFIYDDKGKLRFTEVGYTTTAGLLARMEWIKK